MECTLNSRPICYRTHNDLDEIVTPGHFLVGSNLSLLPEFDGLNTPKAACWKHVQQIAMSFWRCWSKAYLNMLQTRNKWLERHENAQIGDVVLMIDDNLTPLKWRLARVTEVFPDQEGVVRAVDVCDSSHIIFRRSIHK